MAQKSIGDNTRFGGSAFWMAGLSVVLAYVVSWLMPIGLPPPFWLRGAHYIAYQAIFLPLLIIALEAGVRRHDRTETAHGASLLYGTAADYGAGLIASVFHPVFLENGLYHISQALALSTREAWVAFFWFPVRLQSWLFGMLSALILLLIRAQWGNRRR